jgi:hypothetical protein
VPLPIKPSYTSISSIHKYQRTNKPVIASFMKSQINIDVNGTIPTDYDTASSAGMTTTMNQE